MRAAGSVSAQAQLCRDEDKLMAAVLALHSSSEVLGVGVRWLDGPSALAGRTVVRAFPLGRELSNQLFSCIEQLLPAEQWPQLSRLAVATGPGGFTGTRLTVVLARTLAQQLAIPLHGFSSFLLIARRLLASQAPHEAGQRLWLEQVLAMNCILILTIQYLCLVL